MPSCPLRPHTGSREVSLQILNLMQCTNLGGMEQSLYLLMRSLKGRGFDFQVVALHPLGPGKEILEAIGVPAIGCPYEGKFGLLSQHFYRRQVARHRPDLVLVTGASLGSCWASRCFSKTPKVLAVHFHHGRSTWDRWRWRVFYRLASGAFDKIVFNSDFLLAEAVEIFPPLRGRALAVPNPIPMPEIPQAADRIRAKEALGLPRESRVIGNAGWLISRKRFDLLLRIAARLLATHPDLQVLIAGSGYDEPALKGLAATLGLGPRVHWLGWQKDLRQFYQALDLLVFNSDADSVGLTPLEAMAYGLPVVASVAYGKGLSETLHHEKSGFLLGEHRLDLLTDYCDRLLRDRELAARIGSAARQAVIDRHHPEKVASVWQAVFAELAGDTPGRCG